MFRLLGLGVYDLDFEPWGSQVPVHPPATELFKYTPENMR